MKTMPNGKKCKYCKVYGQKFVYLLQEGNRSGVDAYIYNDDLIVGGWYDSAVGIQPQSVKINFCPICGRKLEKL